MAIHRIITIPLILAFSLVNAQVVFGKPRRRPKKPSVISITQTGMLSQRCVAFLRKGMSFPSDCQEELNTACDEIAAKREKRRGRRNRIPKVRECEPSWKAVVFGKSKRKKSARPPRQDSDGESPTGHVEGVETWEGAEDGEYAPAYEMGAEGGDDGWTSVTGQVDLLADEPAEFVGAAAFIGRSWILERGKDLKTAYQPFIHIGAEVHYQLFSLFKIALVAEYEYLSGSTVATRELRVRQDLYDENNDPYVRYPRDVGAFLNRKWTLGLRPTVRMNVHLGALEISGGVGAGLHYFSTSGIWRAKLSLEDDQNDNNMIPETQVQWETEDDVHADEAKYEFDVSNVGLYAAFEAAAIARFSDRRFGIGVLCSYTIPFHWGMEPTVTVAQDYEDPPQGEKADEADYVDTFIRHLGSMDLLTLSLVVDARF